MRKKKEYKDIEVVKALEDEIKSNNQQTEDSSELEIITDIESQEENKTEESKTNDDNNLEEEIIEVESDTYRNTNKDDEEISKVEPYVPPMILDSISYAENENEQKKEEKNKAREDAKALKDKLKEQKIRIKENKKNNKEVVRYECDINAGLTSEEVDERYLDGLTNDLKNKTSKSIPKIFFTNIVTFFNILIFIIAGFLISVRAFTDLVFLLIVTINIVLGIIQEIRAKKMIDNLSLMSAPSAIVIRNGKVQEINTDEVVLDDIMLLEAGNQICSDSILLEGNIEVNESLLTGESDAIVKHVGDTLYSGSFVVSGKAKVRVDKVGKDNYIERLSSQAKVYKKPKSDLLYSLNLIIKIMIFPVVILGLSLFVRQLNGNSADIEFNLFSNLLSGVGNYMDLKPVIRKTAGAMIGMIPSGLFLMSSIALFVGVIRLAQRKVLVQELYCIEMLARVNCICLDKTGTITDGTMNVKNVVDYNNISGLTTKNIVSAMLNALQDNNLTSKALQDKFGLGKRIKHTASIPFSSQRKYQAVTFDKYGTFILGAPEFVLKEDFKLYKKDVDKNAALGYRVLCLAHKAGTIENGNLPDGEIELVSMILIEDNIRPDAINTIKYFRDSGVQVKVISGDNPITVSKISQRAGVENAQNFISLDGLSDSEVVKAATRYTVFGRVSPAQKRLLVRTLKEKGLTVAMTGDGVNDILALKEADCSIAVASGSEAARNCSHLVLIDSNFDSMPYVVAEGRRVINNVTSVASLFLTKTIFSLFLAIMALITGNYPISPNQLILIDLLAIGIPSLVLIMEPNNNTVSGKFLVNVIKKALPGAIVILIISIIVFALSEDLNIDNTSLTTIIVIAATHTCLMVLFKTCKPFNMVRKTLCTFCYTMFLLAILIIPQYLEFRPILEFGEYTSNTLESEYVISYPKIDISKENYYVVDGKVISIQKDSNMPNTILSCYEKNGKLYYKFSNMETNIEIVNAKPVVSYSKSGDVYYGGYRVNNLKFQEDATLEVDEYGYVYYVTKNSNNEVVKNPVMITLDRSNDYYGYSIKYGIYEIGSAEQHFRIMPTVKLSDGRYIINDENPVGFSYDAGFKTSLDNSKITINPTTMELLIDNEPVYARKNGVALNTYKVTLPTITTSCGNEEDNHVYLNATATGYTIFELYGTESKEVINNKEYNIYTIYKDDKKYSYCDELSSIYINSLSEDNYDNPINKSDFVFENLVQDGFKKYKDSVLGASIDVNGTSKIEVSAVNGYSNYFISGGKLPLTDLKDKCTLQNIILSPTISTTSANRYIIDGYYYETPNEISATAELNPHKNADNYLVLGGLVTDYKIPAENIVKRTSGTVTTLSITNRIFLLMLCLLVAPLMKILQNIVPFIKKQSKELQKLLSKY